MSSSSQSDQYAEHKGCVICLQYTAETVQSVGLKGFQTLLRASETRGCDSLTNYLQSQPNEVLVHSSCRKRFTDLRQVSVTDNSDCVNSKKLRSTGDQFDWKSACFLCASGTVRSAEAGLVHKVETLQLQSTLLHYCAVRNDAWATEVKGRIAACNDLCAEEAWYHRNCYMRFIQNRSLLLDNSVGVGRHADSEKSGAFDAACEWLENECDSCLLTLDELLHKMSAFGWKDQYSKKSLKQKLRDRYGEHIVFAEISGKRNVICFRDMCSFILSEQWYKERKRDIQDEKLRVIQTAAKLIAAEIREVTYDMKSYPTVDQLTDYDCPVVPPLLQTMMTSLVKNKLKCLALSQCIVQAARPRCIISPVLFGLSVELDHMFGSKVLLMQLARLGLCLSYDEVLRFKQSVVSSEEPGAVSGLSYPTAFTQYMADNVDHNICSLDGRGSLHGMGIIAATTCIHDDVKLPAKQIDRLPARLKVSDVLEGRRMAVTPYNGVTKTGLKDVTLQPIAQLQQPLVFPPLSNLILLWHTGNTTASDSDMRPSWSGYMQHCCRRRDEKAASIQFLPVIDLNPSDESCIYTTLLYVHKHASELGIVTPCVTFDMPLWLKAVDITAATGLNVVCRLGAFHTLMSYLGSIGRMMEGSGLADLLKLNYGLDTVNHIMTGKSVSKAVRAHFMVDAALNVTLLRGIIPQSSDRTSHSDNIQWTIDELTRMYSETYPGDFGSNDGDLLCNPVLSKLQEGIQNVSSHLLEQSRTARLWLHYMKCVQTMRLFLLAERTCNWHLHLHCVKDMLNLFACTGHNMYAKGCRLYLQMMMDLPNSHPWL